jgi:hypothetical protein
MKAQNRKNRRINIYLNGEYIATTHKPTLREARAGFLADPRYMGAQGIMMRADATTDNIAVHFADSE